MSVNSSFLMSFLHSEMHDDVLDSLQNGPQNIFQTSPSFNRAVLYKDTVGMSLCDFHSWNRKDIALLDHPLYKKAAPCHEDPQATLRRDQHHAERRPLTNSHCAGHVSDPCRKGSSRIYPVKAVNNCIPNHIFTTTSCEPLASTIQLSCFQITDSQKL